MYPASDNTHSGGIFCSCANQIRYRRARHDTADVTAFKAKTDTSASSVYVMLANFSHEKLTLPKATVLGVAE